MTELFLLALIPVGVCKPAMQAVLSLQMRFVILGEKKGKSVSQHLVITK